MIQTIKPQLREASRRSAAKADQCFTKNRKNMKTKLTQYLMAALLGVAPSQRQVLPILLMWLVAVCNANATLYSVELIDNDGPHITGVVDTTADTFTILTWIENPGGTAFWSGNDLPRTYQAKNSNGNAYDVPDNWNGTMSGWGFLNPNNFYHSGWNEGASADDIYLFDGWGIGLVQASYSTGGASAWNMMPVGGSSFATANFDSVVVLLAGSDACTNAPVVSEGTYSGNTDSASNDGTSSCPAAATSPDVWFAYQASSNGVANARTGPGLGTDFDTALAVFDGCGGNEIVANDDAYQDGIGISEVSWEVMANQVYLIRVAGSAGDTGNYALEIRVDPQQINDHCADALAVTDGTYVGTTVGTTTEGILDCVNPETHDVWFVYTNPEDCAKDVTFSTCNGVTDFDTVLRAYDGCGGSFLGLNDDGCAGPNTGASTLTRTVQPFVSVWIRLNGYASATGQYQLDVSSVYNPATFCAATLLHWALEEGSGTNTTESISGETNVAFLSGPAVWTGGISPGSANGVSLGIDSPASYVDAGTLTTNGNYVAGGDPGFRVLQNNWSITAWVRLNNPQSVATDRVIASSDWDSTDGWLFFVWDVGVQENLAFDFGSDRQSSGLTLPLNQTVFVAITADTSGASFPGGTNKHQFAVWDGTSWQTALGTQFRNIRLQGIEIGAFNNGDRQFDGIIDDVRIFDRALTQAELESVAMIPPTLAIAPAGAGSNNISWTPDLPGYVLQETPGLAPATWTNSPSGSTNPIVVPATLPTKFYRLFKP